MNLARLTPTLHMLSGRKDVLFATMLVAVIFMMILPLPTGLVDVLIGINMGLAVVLLMVAVYLHSPLEFVAFPSVLLITTLFRLSLSITTTRLILLQADAGSIIEAFGSFVVGGNLVVGLVIFLIITVVQFLVITKGSERVAEVSARFSLDAMPGKQMSIDGDMRAGVIDVDEARHRRSQVQKESQLYGSMDGAMKFVKGDSIAGLIIIAVNILGGIAIGTLQNGMTSGEALELYAILTIGDGLVAQIPALFIAITAGIIVTRVTTDESENLGADIANQISGKPQAILIGGGLLFAFALIPGFPTFTFIALAVTLLTAGYMILKKSRATADRDHRPLTAMAAAGQPPTRAQLNEAEEFTFTVPLMVDLAADAEEALDTNELNEEILKIRRALYLDLGVPFPGIHLRINHSLSGGCYRIHLQETPIAEGEIRPRQILVRDQKEQLELLSIEHQSEVELLPNVPAYWVEQSHRSSLERMEVAYLTPPRVLSYHLSIILKKYAQDFIGIQETRFLLEKMEDRYGELVKEVQRLLPIQKITEIFQRLVSEDISIRNLRNILEALVEWGQKEKETVLLTEYVRNNLRRYISYKYSNGQNVLPGYLLDQSLEDCIRNGIRQTSAGAYLALDPDTTRQIVEVTRKTVGDIHQTTHKPVLITSMDIRRYMRKLLERELHQLPVLSYQDLTPEITIQPLGRVGL
ncbi:EscV/YscV/HrcV family type III secretion system export apparatus protein [Hahella sp. CCB-MM4]|uniref:type III secretion system export apparatus subunit SctV n=1 Tax=Hahella sp. (strain CCB-MM4) TaxID=1926491 RepID=UPI000B9A339F|nr:type III secretion system export apparatus subunit SctV [Hahella sp. CCB-MM4]OZG74329.1 EscV/YscV/HrcV family type III secretion system export apparatus protein [Hahella sp. CCB-MM4]